MPLPDDQNVVEMAGALVNGIRGAFNTPLDYRPNHARGVLTKGTFTPTAEAASLSTAPHFNNPSTPMIVRFSNSTGIPAISDKDPNANPRGMTVRFVLSEDGHKHTDIVAHSTAFFPMSTGEGFLQFLGALGSGTIETFLANNPSAAAFVQDPKRSPVSFSTERYFGVNAFKFMDKNGKETYFRYRIIPDAGHSTLSDDELANKPATYLFDDLSERLARGPIGFKLYAQIAEEGDPTDDATKHWPESRKLVELGTMKVDTIETEAESKKDQQKIIFDPIPRVQGLEPSADPLIDLRAAAYLISGRDRRAAAPSA